ncbi:MAG: polysaccharide pyruvyl transferase family protein [Sulfobacillus sp.]
MPGEAGRVVLLGYAGAQNLGDEAILAGSLDLIRRAGDDFTPLVVSLDPADTERRHQVEAWPRTRFGELLKRLGADDRFLLGGGGLLQDSTSLGSLGYYLRAAAAAGRRTPVAYWAIGVGPLSRTGSWVLARAPAPQVAVARDPVSLALLGKAGVPADRLVLGTDAAYQLSSVPERTPRWIGFAPRPVPGLDVWALAGQLAVVARAHDRQIRVFAMDSRQDSDLARQLARSHAPVMEFCELPAESEGILTLFSELEYMVAIRLHAMILASLAGVPSVAVPYDPKVEREARLLGMPLWSEWHLHPQAIPGPGRVQLAAIVAGRRTQLQSAFAAMWQALA